MKKCFLLFLLLILGLSAEGKTTYIPSYKSYITIDSVEVSNILMSLESRASNGMFSITIIHEDVTKEKIKAIKRAKAAAGWASFSAAMSGIAAGVSKSRLDYIVNSANAKFSSETTEIYDIIATGEQTLGIEVWLDNTSNQEITVVDKDRGLIWYVLPHETLQIELTNPGLCNLRISDLHHNVVSYATVVAGSSVAKYDISLETESHWYMLNQYLNRRAFSCYEKKNGGYLQIDKATMKAKVISDEEFKIIKNYNDE